MRFASIEQAQRGLPNYEIREENIEWFIYQGDQTLFSTIYEWELLAACEQLATKGRITQSQIPYLGAN